MIPNINQNDKTDKIKELINHANIKWKIMYPYTKFLTIDESVASYKGKFEFKQYLKDKNKSFRLKFFTKASSNKSYIYHLIHYEGKGFQYVKEKGLGASILTRFISTHENGNFHFAFDNYYSNMYSIVHLYSNNIDFTCTFLCNRKGFPNTIKNMKKEKGEKKYSSSIMLIYFSTFINLKTNKFNL